MVMFFANARPVAEVMDLTPDTREMTVGEYRARACPCCGQIDCEQCSMADKIAVANAMEGETEWPRRF